MRRKKFIVHQIGKADIPTAQHFHVLMAVDGLEKEPRQSAFKGDAFFIQFARKTPTFMPGMQSARWGLALMVATKHADTIHDTTIPEFQSNRTPSFGEAYTFPVTDLRSGTYRLVLLWTP